MQNKITYLRVMLTQECNLSCAYCHREGVGRLENRLDARLAIKVIEACYMAGMRKFKFIGGEPTLCSDLPGIIGEISRSDIDVSLISNGLFDQMFLTRCISAGLDRVNISIHAWNSPQSMALCGMSSEQLSVFFRNMEFLLNRKIISKFNYVFLRNADRAELFSIINWINARGQTLDILNVLYAREDSPLAAQYSDFSEIRHIIKQNYGIRRSAIYHNPHSLPSERLYLDEGGVINLKRFTLNTFHPFRSCGDCPSRHLCREGILALRLNPDAHLQPCLLRTDNRMDVSGLAGCTTAELADAIASYLTTL